VAEILNRCIQFRRVGHGSSRGRHRGPGKQVGQRRIGAAERSKKSMHSEKGWKVGYAASRA
jgi:hypothetical protein